MADKPILTYWEGRGRAESIRMIFALAGVEWEHAPFLRTPEQMAQLREDELLMFQQAPLLQWHGKNLVQTQAIVRHIARKYGFDGKNEDEKLQVDMLCEGALDFLGSFIVYKFIPDDQFMAGVEKALARYMPVFEKVLVASKSGFLVGDSITLADIKLFEVLTNLPERYPDAFNGYPKLKEFYDKIMGVPQIEKYMNGPQRFGPNHSEYVKEVKYTLGW